MQNWRKTRSYRKIKNPDGSFTYLIKAEDMYVLVSKEVYTVYAQSERQLEYMALDLKRDRVLQGADGKAVLDQTGQPSMLPEREISLDKLMGEEWDYPSSTPSPETTVLDRLETTALHQSLSSLAVEERTLIEALFFEGLTERAYSERSGIPQKTVNDRKNRILKKLYQLLKK
ncbi:MAG: sigma-70 family RNA polymerase sigma factor [Clostridiales bacterium]|nr:sigma-70 family RNA polymerase sigma factor [Clostridiales bacterium]